MVTAGVFMVARLSPLFEQSQTALYYVTLIGATTAFFAATVGLVQNDIKRVIAYSTCSQLGYMFAALGVGAYGAGIFHLFTHAFFKALLFLGAGSVIHAMHHEQDMQKMGGLSGKIPWTWALMLIGTLALTGLGIPGIGGMAGFYSKDAIVEATHAAGTAVGTYAFWLLVAAAFMTSFYSWRLMFLTFHGKTRADHETFDHAHESPWVMLLPLVLLALGAVAAGALFQSFFIGEGAQAFWKASLATGQHAVAEAAGAAAGHGAEAASHGAEAAGHGAEAVAAAPAAGGHGGAHPPAWVAWSPTIAMAIGFVLSYLCYIVWPGIPNALASNPVTKPLYLFFLNKWYFDELYHYLFVRPAHWLGRFLWKQGDGRIIDGLGPDGLSKAVQTITRDSVKLQSGYVYQYAFVMLIGVTLIATVFALPPGYRFDVAELLKIWFRKGA